MKGKHGKHHGHEEHEERKHGGGVHHGKHHKHHAKGGEPKKADGNPYVIKEAEAGKSIGKIGGVKGKTRLDRKRGGACHAHGGGVHHDGSKHHGHHAHHDGMPKVHAGHGGVAKHHSAGGGHHHKHHASGGGADTTPYSSAGRGLRAAKGGHAHHGHR